MPSTNEYAQQLARARRDSHMMTEGRRVVPMESQIGICNTCGEEPCVCECNEDSDGLEGSITRESIEVVEILAATDPHTFTFLTECEGLKVAAIRDQDPLEKQTLPEEIAAIAEVINEDIMELDNGLDKHQSAIKELAADYGYCVHK